MFKFLAGVILIFISSVAAKAGDATTSNICIISAITLIGVGLDSIFQKK